MEKREGAVDIAEHSLQLLKFFVLSLGKNSYIITLDTYVWNESSYFAKFAKPSLDELNSSLQIVYEIPFDIHWDTFYIIILCKVKPNFMINGVPDMYNL